MRQRYSLPLVPHPLYHHLSSHGLKVLRPVVQDGIVTFTERFERTPAHVRDVQIQLDSGADTSIITPDLRRATNLEFNDCVALEIILAPLARQLLLLEV